MHDLNNLIAQQSLVVKNAEKFRENPDFVDDAIETIAHSVSRMKRLMEQLNSGSKASMMRQTNLRDALEKALDRCKSRQPVPDADIAGEPILLAADPERLTTVFEHIIRNAQDATDTNGKIKVAVATGSDTAQVSISDSGQGMSAEFIRERLFRPFDSTKGSQSMGIGAYQARDYVRMLDGQIEVSSEIGVGTEFSIRFPIVDGG
jgi:putative PEP-CTERM system histidine kinase